MTNKIYIRNTQQNFKKRSLWRKESTWTHYATRHFTSIWPQGAAAAPTPGMQRDLIECNILWRGNPISVIKTFGKFTCPLCNRERMEIVKLNRTIPDKLINSCFLEIHGACHHKPRFHRYHEQTKQPPVRMSAKSAKKSPCWKSQTQQEEELSHSIQMGMNP
jgi:hypothetical protein